WLAGRGILDRPMLDPALAHQARQRQNALMAALLRIIARRPVVAFMVIGLGVGAFVVTGALAGRDGVVDLARRSVRWRVPVRWYLVALFTVPVGATLISLAIFGPRALAAPGGGWPRALAEVAAVFLLQLVLFHLADEVGFTGFLHHPWRDRYHPRNLTKYVALRCP